ncbi:tubulin polyglutamylase complex subunit 1 [Protopterus annectens]|uniref:tubulin polyglutamylase complex subunit 1 n=1 Tax=Protopterus annectens TaxID=7888 RepID=UPI001CF9D45F|nr:tubulin polyglutamylase complex subunit 1 [Protopterus annectens]
MLVEKMEKRRVHNAGSSDSKAFKEECEREFLSQSGVRIMLREALMKLLETRPEEPITFLANHFHSLVLNSEGGGGDQGQMQQSVVNRAMWHLRVAHPSQRAAFNNSVGIAYDILLTNGRKKKPGLNGRMYSDLLKRICNEGRIPENISGSLLKKIQCREHEAVPFEIFRYSMLTCFIFLEYLSKSSSLFETLSDSKKADKRLCEIVLETLEDALQASNLSIPASYLEAGSKLGPDRLALEMNKLLINHKPASFMQKGEFLQKAAALFIEKVKSIS